MHSERQVFQPPGVSIETEVSSVPRATVMVLDAHVEQQHQQPHSHLSQHNHTVPLCCPQQPDTLVLSAQLQHASHTQGHRQRNVRHLEHGGSGRHTSHENETVCVCVFICVTIAYM